MPEQHTILGGKVYVYKRPNSSLWQCSTYFAGQNRRISTKEGSLSKAKEIAENWYLQLRGKFRHPGVVGSSTSHSSRFDRHRAAVTRRSLPHHPPYGSAHGSSSGLR
jgi:hypothetical protein